MGFVEEQAQAWREVRGCWEDSRLFTPPPETSDGPLATLASTAPLRDWLPRQLTAYGVHSMLDAPCGDWNWMRHVELGAVTYTGWDVDQGRIDLCRDRAEDRDVAFGCVNLLTVAQIPAYDLILCRHFTQHLPLNDLVAFVLAKFELSGSRYLLTTTYPGADNSFEWDPDGYEHAWKGYFERPVDLEAPPFLLGPKLAAFTETPGPAGVIARPHELALFALSQTREEP